MAHPYLFISAFFGTLIFHSAIKYERYKRNVDSTNTTNFDTALMFADEFVLPGLEFTFACQPMKAAIDSARTILTTARYVQTTAVLGESLVLVTSTFKNVLHLTIDYTTQSPAHFGAPFGEDLSKELPILMCKLLHGNKIVCNLIGEATRELPRLLVHDEKANTLEWGTWLNKIPKAGAKTLHQIVEKNLCLKVLGDPLGYIVCGWTRSLFYKAPNFVTSTYQGYFSSHQEQQKLEPCQDPNSSHLSQPCPPETELQLQLSPWNTNYKAFPPQEIRLHYMNQIAENRILVLLSPKFLILFSSPQQVDITMNTWLETFGAIITAKAGAEHFSITRNSETMNDDNFIFQTATVKSLGDHHNYADMCSA